jgi:hypothetical protein
MATQGEQVSISTQEFLDQFQRSKDNVESWPHWMQQAARVATASFPLSKKTEQINETASSN